MCDSDVTLKDRYVAYIKSVAPEYEYSCPHFGLAEDGSVLYWNLELPQPTSEQLAAVVVTKECPVSCIGCIVRRVNIIETKLKDLEDVVKSFD